MRFTHAACISRKRCSIMHNRPTLPSMELPRIPLSDLERYRVIKYRMGYNFQNIRTATSVSFLVWRRRFSPSAWLGPGSNPGEPRPAASAR